MEKFNHITDKIQKFSRVESGTLYLVSTPIGNLEDISYRALNILKNVDLILAEDSRISAILLNKFGIRNRIISYFSRIEDKKSEFIIEKLKNNASAALISDSGTPLVSDPGFLLVRRCIEEGINIRSVPGASALVQSIVLSGFGKNKFYFQGFIPVKKSRNKTFEELSQIKIPIIVYESKYRLAQTIKDIYRFFGNAEIFIARELTKKFEQTISGRVNDIIKENNIRMKGEFTIVINKNL